MFRYLDISLEPSSRLMTGPPRYLCALTINGVLFYVLGRSSSVAGARSSSGRRNAVRVAPFSALEPLAYLVESQHYKPVIDWVYVGCGTPSLSHHRQRRLLLRSSTRARPLLIADRCEWFDDSGARIIVLGSPCSRRIRLRPVELREGPPRT
jgi:hypothetical protein